MVKPDSKKNQWIWLSILILFVCVAATTIAYMSRLSVFLLDATGAISLIPELVLEPEDSAAEDRQQYAEIPQLADAGRSSQVQILPNTDTAATLGPSLAPAVPEPLPATPTAPTMLPAPPVPRLPENPGFEVGDDQGLWSTDTLVEIFRVAYANGEQVITVDSNDGDKVIAPGTDNSYTFKLKNTGDVALDYVVEVDAHFTPADVTMPISCRLNRYDGAWIAGSQDNYVAVETLDAAVDTATLGAGKYTYYTLDWVWPFEHENDEWDTLLGDLATGQDLIFAIAIRTTAYESGHPENDSGIAPPKTGDHTRLALWIALAVCSFVMILLLMLYQGRRKQYSDWEAEER